MIDRERLKQDLQFDEGLWLKPYLDSVGKTTIGIGRNLTDNGITHAEADYLFKNDLLTHEHEIRTAFSWFEELNAVRQAVLINLCFNMGLPRLRTFVKMLAALERHDWTRASEELEDSLWAKQVQTSRSSRLIRELRTGQF